MRYSQAYRHRKSIQLPAINLHGLARHQNATKSQQKSHVFEQFPVSPKRYPPIRQHQKLLSNFLIGYLHRKADQQGKTEKRPSKRIPQIIRHENKIDPAYNFRFARRIKERRRQKGQGKNHPQIEVCDFTLPNFDLNLKPLPGLKEQLQFF